MNPALVIVAVCVGVAVAFGIGVGAGTAWQRARTASGERDAVAGDGVGMPATALDGDRVQDAAAVDRAVVERHPVGIVVADRSGEIVYRNAAARNWQGGHTGVLVEAVIDRHLGLARSRHASQEPGRAPSSGNHNHNHNDNSNDNSKDGDESTETVELFGPPKRVAVVSAQPLPGGGAVAYVDDATESHRLDRARTDFVANLSHELKTPIGALSVLAETMRDERDGEVQRRLADRMIDETDRANRTIGDLIELSRIEATRAPASATVSLAGVVDVAVERVRQLAQERRVTIERQSEPIVISGQARSLESAIGNLVENAVTYSAPGQVVNVSIRSLDPEANAGIGVEIEVSDDGIGIPDSDQERIFERFYRVDRARSRATGGTGLGLSIVRHAITAHGGTVTVRSSEGAGSTFTIRLPATTIVSNGVES